VLNGVDLLVGPTDRIGLMGRNGTGKSTLLDVLAGRRAPSAGELEQGPSVVIGYHSQDAADLDPSAIVRDLVAGPTRSPGGHEDEALMARFWFTGELARAPVATLSGGERRRLQLLLVLAARPNVLLLDEPTNDLDLDTLRSLEDLLDAWPGAILVASHDRSFLERTTDRLVGLENGVLSGVAGGVGGWLARLESGTGEPPRTRPAAQGGTTPSTQPSRPPPGTTSRAVTRARLREAERAVGRLEQRRSQLVAEMELAIGHESLAAVGLALAETQASLLEAEERWLELAGEEEAAR